eukprot:10160538-Alexandrium_andersonii.AAC.1
MSSGSGPPRPLKVRGFRHGLRLRPPPPPGSGELPLATSDVSSIVPWVGLMSTLCVRAWWGHMVRVYNVYGWLASERRREARTRTVAMFEAVAEDS